MLMRQAATGAATRRVFDPAFSSFASTYGSGGGSTLEAGFQFTRHEDFITITNDGRTYNDTNTVTNQAYTGRAIPEGGKYYWEMVVDADIDEHAAVGVGSGYTYPGQDAILAWARSGDVRVNDADEGATAPYGVGDILGLAIDMTTDLLYLYINNVLATSIDFEDIRTFTDSDGSVYPIARDNSGGGTNPVQMTINRSPSEQTYAPPAGYSPLQADAAAFSDGFDEGYQ